MIPLICYSVSFDLILSTWFNCFSVCHFDSTHLIQMIHMIIRIIYEIVLIHLFSLVIFDVIFLLVCLLAWFESFDANDLNMWVIGVNKLHWLDKFDHSFSAAWADSFSLLRSLDYMSHWIKLNLNESNWVN